MQFLFPAFLFGLSALAVPVVIHLFNFRRFKTVYFSNVAFLKEIREETASRSRVKHLLVLACRMLAIAFLVLAFAQPFIPKKNTNISAGKKYVSVYVDNSFSMGAMSGGLRLLDKARQAAKEIVQNYAANDRFQLLTNDFSGRQQRLVSKEEFLSMLDEVDISPASRPLNEIYRRQADVLSLDNSKNKIAYLLSDFQRSMGFFVPDTTIRTNVVALAADAQQNIYIDTAWFAEPVQMPDKNCHLMVRIKNSGEKAVEGNRLQLKLNGQVKGIADFSVAAGSYTIDTIGFSVSKAGWNKAELSLQDFPITYDDNYYLAFPVADKIGVLSVSEGKANEYIDAVFKDQPEFAYKQVLAGSLDYSQIKEHQFVLLSDISVISSGLSNALAAYLADGGTVCLFPSARADLASYNALFSALGMDAIDGLKEEVQEVAKIEVQQGLFNDVFEKMPENTAWPGVKKYYQIQAKPASNTEIVLGLKNGKAFLIKNNYKSGALYFCASPLDKGSSDLPVHALFAPAMYKMAISGGAAENIAYTIGDKAGISIRAGRNSSGKVYKLKGEQTEFIPQQFAVGNKILLGLGGQIKKSGFYQVSPENSDTAEVIALNFDRRESELSFCTPEELKTRYAGPKVNVVNSVGMEIAQVIRDMDRGTSLWKACLVLALLALLAEVLLLRFWRQDRRRVSTKP